MSTTTRTVRGTPGTTRTHTGEPDRRRLRELRELAQRAPADAEARAWDWLRELQHPAQHHRLDGLFAAGTVPNAPDGDCEGIVMGLYGSPWLVVLDRLVRLGQLLGGIGWTGKSFDPRAGTGFNRLTASARPAAFLTMPTYRFRAVNGELIGFHFRHSRERSPVAPHHEVLAIRYDAPEDANPLVLPRTRDELVEVVPNVLLGRALLRDARGGGFEVVGYFGLRHPVGGR